MCVQRDAGVQRLSLHFSWLELSDEPRLFHQEFVFDVAMFAASRGFSWTDVIRAAVIAKGIFPRLEGKSKHRASPRGQDQGGASERAVCFLRAFKVHGNTCLPV